MDDDYEDLLGDGAGDEIIREVGAESGPAPIKDMPTENELRLGKRVLELEKERESIMGELEKLRAERDLSGPIQGPGPPTTEEKKSIIIPHELLPTLGVLRDHISELTRDNAALRYTFLGPPRTSHATSSKVTLDVPMKDEGLTATIPGGVQGIDLEDVVAHVKELIKENEELGEMVLEAGKAGSGEWQKALEESKAVIVSLDSDLEHHLGVIQALRTELVAYKTHFGPIPKDTAPPTGPKASAGDKRDKDSHSSHRHRDRERDREREKDKEKEKDRQKEERERGIKHERDTPSRGEVKPPRGPGDRRDDRRHDASRGGGGSRSEPSRRESTSIRKDDDRDYKRRR